MALISCPECGRQVSDKAAACPNCAHPISAGPSGAVTAPERHAPPHRAPAETTRRRVSVPLPSFRTRAQPSAWVAILALLGLVLLLYGSWLLGLLLIALPIIDYLASFIEVGPTAVRVKRGLLHPTTDIQLSKIETVQVGFGIGGWKSVTVVGSGGTLVGLGTLFNADVVYDRLQEAIAARR